MALCKECIHNEMCYATHTDESPACCDYKAVQRWIPVTERLPENSNAVLCITRKGNPFVGRYDHKWNHWAVSGSVTITHWMPLPEPPKEDAE